MRILGAGEGEAGAFTGVSLTRVVVALRSPRRTVLVWRSSRGETQRPHELVVGVLALVRRGGDRERVSLVGEWTGDVMRAYAGMQECRSGCALRSHVSRKAVRSRTLWSLR